MLLELRIGNLALAEDVVLRPGPGLTVLTGETGAGKSLIAGALALLAGDRGDRGLVRHGEDAAWVEAVCDLSGRPDLRDEATRLGLRLVDDGLLVLRRELRREGRGRVLINGELSSLAVLERLGAALLAIQSQRQQQELRAAGFAREVLDTVLDLAAERAAVAAALAAYQAAVAELTRRRQEHELAQQQLEIWRYQFAELDRADLDPDEEAALSEAIAIKRDAQGLQTAAAGALAGLQDGPAPARETLGAAISALGAHAARSTRPGGRLARPAGRRRTHRRGRR
jgi:DNA repair protein RecN (Recombination protein N)